MEFHALFLASLRRKLSLAMIRSFFEKDERAVEQRLLRLYPQHAGSIDAAVMRNITAFRAPPLATGT
jgi:hypothetical protein